MTQSAFALAFERAEMARKACEERERRALEQLAQLARKRERQPTLNTRLAALYRKGKTVGQMSTELRISRRAVYRHLTTALRATR